MNYSNYVVKILSDDEKKILKLCFERHNLHAIEPSFDDDNRMKLMQNPTIKQFNS